MEASRQQLQAYRANQGPIRPVLEEFIPLKTSSSECSADQKTTNPSDNKANWMTSVQLWSQSDATKPQTQNNNITQKEADNISFNVVSPKLALGNKLSQRINGTAGAFLPFSKDNRTNSSPSQGFRPLPELALAAASADKDIMGEEKKCTSEGENGLRRENSGKVLSNGNSGVVVESGKGLVAGMNSNINVSEQGQTTITNNTTNNSSSTITTTTTTNQTHRKARRCWSPDLHRRFVNALQMLVGSQGNQILMIEITFIYYVNKYNFKIISNDYHIITLLFIYSYSCNSETD